MLHAPDFLGYDERDRDGQRPPRGRRARAAIKKAGNALIEAVGGREIHPVNVRVGGFYRAPDAGRAARRLAELLERAREAALETVALDRAACRSPTSSATTSSSRCATPRRVPDRSRPHRLERGPRHRAARSSTTTSSRSTSPHSNALHSRLRDARELPRRAAGALQPDLRRALAARARGGAGGRRSARCAATRSRASSCARSRCSTPATRRCGSSTATSRPTRRPSRSRRARGVGYGATEAPRGMLLPPLRDRRRRARSSTRGSSRRRRRTSARSRRTCARVGRARTSTSTTTRCAMRCEQAIRNYDPCISCATHFLTLDVDRAIVVIGVGNRAARRRRGRARGRAALRGRLRRASSSTGSRARWSSCWDGRARR